MQASELQHVGSAVAAPGLWSTGSAAAVHALSCSTACGIVPDQGLNPCLLHGQVDSLPLSHQGSPQISDFKSERWTFLAIQWLRLHAPIARGWGLILGQGTKILQAAPHGQKKKLNTQVLTMTCSDLLPGQVGGACPAVGWKKFRTLGGSLAVKQKPLDCFLLCCC